MREALKRFFISFTGAPWSEALGRRIFDHRLRVLAYHDVSNPASFGAQMRHIDRHYMPVSLEDVLAAASGSRMLPRGAVWVTFDDGHPGVVRNAMPVLNQLGIRATLFVCPGVVGTTQPFWWEVVSAAVEHGINPAFGGQLWTKGTPVTGLNSVPDPVRRSVVAELAKKLEALGIRVQREQLRRQDLMSWVRAGHDVGNHTWDHPSLDQCSAAEQERQIDRADRWLRSNLPSYVPAFAYPKGNWWESAEGTLVRLGYRVAVGFDHQVARPRESFLRLSRLRVSAEANMTRFRAIVSGLHTIPFIFADPSPSTRARQMSSLR